MPNLIIAVEKKLRIPLLANYVDGFLNEQHTVTVQKNDVPIEDGSPITDHATIKPERLNCTGVVIDRGFGSTPEEGWAALRRVQRTLDPVQVFSFIGVYDAMLITSIRASRVGDNFTFDMQLDAVLLAMVQEEVVSNGIGPATNRGANIERGRVEPKELPGTFQSINLLPSFN